MIKKRSINEESDARHSKLQKAVKKFFASNGEAHKVFKTDEINCLTGDCRVLTAKISKSYSHNPDNSVFFYHVRKQNLLFFYHF